MVGQGRGQELRPWGLRGTAPFAAVPDHAAGAKVRLVHVGSRSYSPSIPEQAGPTAPGARATTRHPAPLGWRVGSGSQEPTQAPAPRRKEPYP
jgi:hypothetical protein